MSSISNDIIMLQTKLVPPPLKNMLERRRLNALFDNITSTKAISITAGAGYGKTTMAAQACKNRGLKVAWYRLDPSDSDLIVFIHYLIKSIRQHVNAFGDLALERIHSAEQLKSEQRSILMVLLHEMEQHIREHLILVLDDFHLIEDSPEIQTALTFLLPHLPDQVHFLIISRKIVNLGLPRLIASRQAFCITEKDLAFEETEMDELFRQIFNMPLRREELTALVQKTGGWAAGLILFHYTSRDKAPESIGERISLLTGNSNLFGDYLEENVFKMLPEEIKAFLLKTSLLSQLNVKFCNQLLGIDNAGEILQRLEKLHLFTFALNESRDTYHYHHLLRDFLRARLSIDTSARHIAGLNHNIAALWEEHNAYTEAIHHYLAAGDHTAACKVLVKNGPAMIESGKLNQIISYCRQIPAHQMEQAPWIKYLLGRALFLKGKTREALETVENARQQFESQGDEYGAGLCLTRLASGYFILSDFVKAELMLKEVLTRVRHTPNTYAYCLGSLIFVSSRLGKIDQADSYYQEAADFISATTETPSMAWVYAGYGTRFFQSEEFGQAIHYGEKACKMAERFNKYSLVVMSCHLSSIAWMALGNHDKSYEMAAKGIQVAEKHNFLDISYAWCLGDAGFAQVQAGHVSEGIDYCLKSLQVCQNTDSDWTEAWAHFSLSHAYLKTGELEKAEMAGRKALDTIRNTTLQTDPMFLAVSLGWILLEMNKPKEALTLVESIGQPLAYAKEINYWVQIFHVRYHWITDRKPTARMLLAQLLERLRDHQRYHVIFLHQYWIAPLLVELYNDQLFQAEIQIILSQFAPAFQAPLEQSKSPGSVAASKVDSMQPKDRQGLKVTLFGRFLMSRNGIGITDQQWTSGKAKMLFKYLAFHPGKGYIHKDQLLELLWPGEDPMVTSKRLHVALSALRKTIEPELKRGARSSYLLRENDAYRLDLGENGIVDVIAFDQAMAAAEKAITPEKRLEWYLDALAIYKGDLFEEDSYTQWCVDAKEIYKQKHLDLLKKIAALYKSKEDFDTCIDYLRRAIQVDPYAEDVCRQLMTMYHKTGNRFTAIKIYEQLKNKLEDELQCPMSDETQELYQQIK
jgi:ATP/maltotriose-dependent transcriptional regulator MalT/DNA-binding SARP family transcriptional activator